MTKFTLGIIGRCTSLQPWMHPSDLYHRLLKKHLQEHDKVDLTVSIASRSDLDPYERLKILHTKKPLDGLLLIMRYVVNQPLFIIKKNTSGEMQHFLHPDFAQCILAGQKYAYIEDNHMRPRLPKEDLDDLFNLLPPPPKKFLGLSRRGVNLWAGNLCGLNRWAIKNDWFFLEKLCNLSSELNIPLFVIGPFPRFNLTDPKTTFRLLRPLYKKIATQMTKDQIPYYLLKASHDDQGASLFKPDQIHLSIAGHAFLAKELYPIISPWIESILSKKDQKILDHAKSTNVICG